MKHLFHKKIFFRSSHPDDQLNELNMKLIASIHINI